MDLFSEFTRDETHSVLISSHILSDLEKICDYVAFLHQGQLLFCEEKDTLLERYGLASFARKKPAQLSGGMRQRCALIRTLATDPSTLLLDEPFSALDYQTRLAVSADIWHIIRQEGKTALLVTHDIAEAVSMSDRVVVLSRRPAVVKAEMDMGALRGLPPLERRDTPEFHRYFNAIWKELDVHA